MSFKIKNMNTKNPLILAGTKFNRLTCIEYLGKDTNRRRSYLWLCECGNKKAIDGNFVKRGSTKSCGCLSIESKKLRKIPDEEFGINTVIQQYKKGAKNRELVFKLTTEQVKVFLAKECYYCGKPKSNCLKTKLHNNFYYSGIDRIDNSKGYTLDNCVSCCMDCNKAKLAMNREDF